jgi:hypothetical protein
LGCLLANFEFVFLLDGRSGMPEFDADGTYPLCSGFRFRNPGQLPSPFRRSRVCPRATQQSHCKDRDPDRDGGADDCHRSKSLREGFAGRSEQLGADHAGQLT